MSLIGDLKEEIKELEDLAAVTNSFTEINSIKIRKIRASFERNRSFYEEVQAVYHLVNLYARRSPRKSRAGTLCLAVTSNSRFYGNLNLMVIDEFQKETQRIKTDLLIVGRTGIAYANSKKNFPKFEPIRFEKDFPTPDEVGRLAKNVGGYEKVLVYYPKFLTIFSQKVGSSDITQTIESSEAPERKFEIIFEPEVDKMAEFFSQQMRAVLFTRVMLETDLSWTSARLLSMNESSQKNAALAKSRRTDLTKAFKALQNARLLETFSGLGAWKESNRT